MVTKALELEAVVDKDGVLHVDADVPTNLPEGKVTVSMRLDPAKRCGSARKKIHPETEDFGRDIEEVLALFPEERREEMRKSPNAFLLRLYGIAKDEKIDGLTWQKKIRAEWE